LKDQQPKENPNNSKIRIDKKKMTGPHKGTKGGRKYDVLKVNGER